MFNEAIEKLNHEIEQAKAKLAELEAKKKAVMDMSNRMNAVLEEVNVISQELSNYPDMLINFERSIRDTIRPHKPVKSTDNLPLFKDTQFNLQNSGNSMVKFYTNDNGDDIFASLIAMTDKRTARKWQSFYETKYAFATELMAGCWSNEFRYTLGIANDVDNNMNDDCINQILKYNYLNSPEALDAPKEQETHIKAPQKPTTKTLPQPKSPNQPKSSDYPLNLSA
jgi:hypothetical protein